MPNSTTTNKPKSNPNNKSQNTKQFDIKNASVSMNIKDIDGEDVVLSDGKTSLVNDFDDFDTLQDVLTQQQTGKELVPSEDKIAVLELSTKAVKLLIGDAQKIRENGFSFEYFPHRHAFMTNTGDGLDSNNVMDLEFFANEVIPQIRKMVVLAKRYNVNTLYTVATAAYRTAENRRDILELIKQETELSVRIISKAEESEAALIAFLFSKPKHIPPNETITMIDQGGGSTEVAVFQDQKITQTYSLNLGSIILKNLLFKNNDVETKIQDAFSHIDQTIVDYLSNNFSPEEQNIPSTALCVGVGSAVTNATGKQTNPEQHGYILSISDIEFVIQCAEEALIEHFPTVKDLSVLFHQTHRRNKKLDMLDKFFIMRLGLPVYINIMKKLGISKIVVSGTGLWYGIYFQVLFGLNN